MKKHIAFIFLCVYNICYSQGYIKAMFYNLYRFPNNRPINREYILKDILAEYNIDLLMVCELMSEEGADKILNIGLQKSQKNFSRAKFVPIKSVSHPQDEEKLQQMVFYNTDKFTLINQKTHKTHIRDINHYTFKLNTNIVDHQPICLEVFVAHLKSSQGKRNRNSRLEMINVFVKALEEIPKNHYVLFSGDLNFYNSEKEPGYKKLLDTTNSIIMTDPIKMPGIWHNNSDFSKIHTQATRTSTHGFGKGGSTGGLDDRFDFIMISENFHTSTDFYYVNNSYKAYGNNGNCIKKKVNNKDCNGIYDLKLRQNLHDMSDHLPVIIEFKTNRNFKLCNTSPSITVKE